MSLEASTAIELDPALMMEAVGLIPDPWQENALRSEAKRLLILCARQLGKSTTAALIALHAALFQDGALILITSRTERQSLELLKKVVGFYHQLGDPVPATRELGECLELANGSRIVALPGSPDNLRGFSAPAMILVDEAGWVSDDLFTAILPMVATSGGRIVVLSTPSGRLGFFAARANDPESQWKQIIAKASECPRIDPAFLEGERKELGEHRYAQEYECMFMGSGGTVFRRITDAIDRGRTETSIVTDTRLAFGIGCDIGRHNDATVITILDSNGVQHYWQRFVDCTFPRQIEAIKAAWTVLEDLANKNLPPGSQPVKLQGPSLVLDVTGMGDPIYEALLEAGIDVFPFTFTHLSKRTVIDKLAAALDNGKLRLMDMEIQENELLSFEVQRTSTGFERMSAPPGQHDDAVIALALAYHGVSGGGWYSAAAY
jgi:Terminase large subunit, T4likevirus-type, N-terminal